MVFDGLILMLVGMAGVFVFLTILVIVMSISAGFFTRFAHLFPDEQPKSSARPAGASDEAIAVAIAAAHNARTRSS